MRHLLAILCLLPSLALADSTTVGGTSDPTAIEDNYIYNSNGAHTEYNYGGSVYCLSGKGPGANDQYIIKQLLRIADTSDIPAGTITAVVFQFYQTANQNSLTPRRMYAHAVKDGINWGVGTSDGTSEASASDWVHYSHTGSSWNGAGASGDDTDWDTASIGDVNPAAKNSGEDSLRSLNFTSTTAFSDWRDGNRDNNGIIIFKTDQTTDNTWTLWHSSDAGNGSEHYFTITYTPPVATDNLFPGMTLFE